MVGPTILIALIVAVVTAGAVFGSGAVQTPLFLSRPSPTATLVAEPRSSATPSFVTPTPTTIVSPTDVPSVKSLVVIEATLPAVTATVVLKEHLDVGRTPVAGRTPHPSHTPAFARVANTDGDGVFLRLTPNLADRLKAWADGTRFSIIGPNVESQGIIWRHVRAPDSSEGYIPAEYLSTLPTDTRLVDTVKLGNTNGEGAFLRRTPNLDDRLTSWAEGTVFSIIGKDVQNKDGVWKHVRAPDNSEGYLPIKFIAGSATATPDSRIPTATVGSNDMSVLPSPTPGGAKSEGALWVAHTDGDGAYLHRRAGTSEFIGAWPDRTLLTIVGPDENIDGSPWKYVKAPDGAEGYIPERYTTTVAPG